MIQQNKVNAAVAISLAEDVGSGDITAALIPEAQNAKARIITRESTVIAGKPWVEAVYRQLDPRVSLNWAVKEGEHVCRDQTLVELRGPTRSLLTGERCALNWLQSLSAVATVTAEYVKALEPYSTTLLDTRKTIPGLRYAQKYAVKCGGGQNHRMGLDDAFLIKENHIMACGSIVKAVEQARQQLPDKSIEVEVENLDELKEALNSDADRILLDNFTLAELEKAVAMNKNRAKLEVSGNISLDSIQSIAATGVDFISVGSLTKHVHAIDLSMRIAGTCSG